MNFIEAFDLCLTHPHLPPPHIMHCKEIYFQVGDHLERIDNQNLVGLQHFEVAKILKEIPIGTTFLLRVVKPRKESLGNHQTISGY